VVALLVRLAEGPDLASVAEVDVPRLGAASDARVRSIDLRTHAALREPESPRRKGRIPTH
jgi:hypothetical protein